MSHQATLNVYAKLVEISDQMLTASKAKDWDSLEQLENVCAEHIETIKQITPTTPISDIERTAKINYIEKLLETDRAIRDEVEPWMAKLAIMMNTTGTQQKLARAYGNNTTH